MSERGRHSPVLVADQCSYEAVARMAVKHLKGCTKSSTALSEICREHLGYAVHSDYVDAALASLVQAGKLIRINVTRGGEHEYDYRYSSVWVPADADFALCSIDGVPPPRPSTSPVAPPQARTAPTPPQPPARPSASPPAAPAPAAEAGWGLRPNHSDAAHVARSLGWSGDPPKPALDVATLDAVLDQSTVLNILEADDLVCAINSRGELAIDLGDGHLIKFPPAQALVLKRFLGGTTVLEDLHARQLI